MADLDKIVDELSELSVIEAADLVKKLEDKWDVSAAAPAAAVAVAAPGGGEAAEGVWPNGSIRPHPFPRPRTGLTWLWGPWHVVQWASRPRPL